MGYNSLHFHTHKKEKNGGYECSHHPKMSIYVVIYLFIYLFLSIHHMVLINMCEEILFSNVVHHKEE